MTDAIAQCRFGFANIIVVEDLRVVAGGLERGQAHAVFVETFPSLECQQHTASCISKSMP